jgi:hypothetical protein
MSLIPRQPAPAVLVGIIVLFIIACGSTPEPVGPTTSERGEADAVLAELIHDEAISVLEEADRFVADDLPARAGEMLESAALPSMRRHIDRVDALVVRTDLGRRLKTSALEKLRTREESTAAYARILARGLVEDLAFVEASAAQRHAEAGLLELGDEIQAIRHPEEDEAPPIPMPSDLDDEFGQPEDRRVRPR